MSILEDGEENWVAKMDSLCSNLNVDPVAAKKSKESFLDIKKNYTLDVSIYQILLFCLSFMGIPMFSGTLLSLSSYKLMWTILYRLSRFTHHHFILLN